MSLFCKIKVFPSTHNPERVMVCGGEMPQNVEDSSKNYLLIVIECLRKITAKIPSKIYNSLNLEKKIK